MYNYVFFISWFKKKKKRKNLVSLIPIVKVCSHMVLGMFLIGVLTMNLNVASD